MSGKGSGSRDPFDGAPADGEDADCEVCKCDLWLSAVVAIPSVVEEGGERGRGGGGGGGTKGASATATASAAATARPRMRVDRRMVCPEHAPALGLPPTRLRLLYRHSLPELEKLVSDACRWVPGAPEAVAAARERAAASAAADPAASGRVAAVPVGPLSQETVLWRKLEVERAEKRARKKAAAAKAAAEAAAAAAAAAAAGLEEEKRDEEGLFAAAPAPAPTPPSSLGDIFSSPPQPAAWNETA